MNSEEIAGQDIPKKVSRTGELLDLITRNISEIEKILKPVLSNIPTERATEKTSKNTELNTALASSAGRLKNLKSRIAV